jgi:predicted nucleic acid-binding protein
MMPPSHILAEVVDIVDDAPTAHDTFFVDTNVWYWISYTRASMRPSPAPGRTVDTYARYIQRVKNAGARLLVCTLSFAELAHIIERKERDIYNYDSRDILDEKTFRYNSSARADVITEIEVAWAQVSGLADIVGITVDTDVTQRALTQLKTQPLDSYDVLLLEAMSNHSMRHIVSHDGDFARVPGIRLFTGNQSLISSAAAQGKLLMGR